MVYGKFRKQAFLWGVVLLLGVALVVLVVVKRQDSQSALQPSNTKASSQGQTTTTTQTGTLAATNDFTYPIPKDWTALPKADLDSVGAVGGIVRSSPTAKFTIAIEPAATTPTTVADLKNSTLEALKKFQNFELLSSGERSVDGQAGQEFTYRFGGTTKIKQDLTIVIYKKRAFSLLFTSAESDYLSQASDFAAILSGFKFK